MLTATATWQGALLCSGASIRRSKTEFWTPDFALRRRPTTASSRRESLACLYNDIIVRTCKQDILCTMRDISKDEMEC